jgi:menaquinone-dependent protoporphyrinogen oxidase
MQKKVLVVYASKYGATKEIAEKISEILQQSGCLVDIFPTNRVNSLETYAAVILGSAVYIGQWQKPAVKFLQANESVLKQKPVWLFSSGPTGKGDPVELLKGWSLPENIKAVVERIHPRGVAVFHGYIDPEKINFLEKQIVKGVKAEMGDFREWDSIVNWAKAIAEAISVE